MWLSSPMTSGEASEYAAHVCHRGQARTTWGRRSTLQQELVQGCPLHAQTQRPVQGLQQGLLRFLGSSLGIGSLTCLHLCTEEKGPGCQPFLMHQSRASQLGMHSPSPRALFKSRFISAFLTSPRQCPHSGNPL